MNERQQPQKQISHTDKRQASLRRKRQQARFRRRLCICFGALLIISCAAISTVRATMKPISITLKLTSTEVLQGEAIPTFQAKAIYDGKRLKRILDKKNSFTVKDFLKELNAGKGYTFSCNADTSIDRTYPVKIVLDNNLKEKMAKKWDAKVTLALAEGQLKVKNPHGYWEEGKFKRNDGNYLTNDFITSGGKTYYFDENGNKVTGERRIGLKTCTFTAEGVLESKEKALVIKDQPLIALTFDDGPSERTSELLDILDRYNAHATFFMQGKNIEHYSDTVKQMNEQGNELGNHSYNHPQLPKLSVTEIQQQLNDTNAAIEKACGVPADVLRPPYGAVSTAVSSHAGMPIILWTVDTLDWNTKDAQAIYDATVPAASDGAVILMHDTLSTTIDAAIRIIPELTRQGFQLVTIQELAKARGITLADGATYREDF